MKVSNTQNFPITILGIDPGYDRLGWAVAIIDHQNSTIHQKLTIKNYGCIQTKKTDDLFNRYQDLKQQLLDLIKQHQPTQAAIESLFFFKNKKTALQVSEARGVVISSLMDHKIKIFEYTPLQIKETVTGYGRADKKAVEKMIRMEFKLKEKKIIDDAIDALAVIMTHSIRGRNEKYYC